jgi:SAM-dependent methyltransferase
VNSRNTKVSGVKELRRVLGWKALWQLRQARTKVWEHLISPHFVTRIIQTLFQVGLIDALRASPSVDVVAFSKKHGYEADVLVALCEALHARRILLRLSATSYSLDDSGRFFAEEPMVRGWFELSNGYENVLYHMEDLVRKKKVYGENGFVRDGRLVATGSGLASTRFYFPYAIHLIKQHSYCRVLDIGCGDGTFLRLLHEADPCIEGVGVDLSPDAVAAGNAQLKEHGLSEKIQLHTCDAMHLDRVAEHLKGVDAATTFFVLHELCDQDKNPKARQFLTAFRKALPEAPFMIFETIRPTPDELRDHPGPAVEYFLFHDLSLQKPISRQAWMELFAASGFPSVEEDYLDFARTSVFTIR